MLFRMYFCNNLGYSGKFIAKLDEKDKIYQEYLEEEKNKGGIENE